MATRSLTDVYFLMRNNAIANKNVFQDNSYFDDRTALVINLDTSDTKTIPIIPPDWTNDVEEVQYEITKLKNKMKELHSLHDKHLNRPTMEDNFEGEKLIDHLTQEITQVLGQCQMRVKKFSNKSNMGKINSSTDKRLLKNVVNNLATALQDLTSDFRKNQNLYLKSNVIKFNNSSHIEPFLSQKIISSIKL